MTIGIKKAKCPACGNGIPFWQHLFFNDIAGFMCPSCGSLIGHSLITKLIKYSLLILMVVSLSYKHQNVIWWVVFACSVAGVIYVQLCSHFKILFERKGKTTEEKT